MRIPRAPYVKRFRRGLVLAAALAIIVLASLGPIDEIAREHVDSGLKRALVTFAIARTANAVISVLQETTVSVAVASAQPLQALDPINDLIEQFSAVMLLACASFGVQRILISLGALPVVWVSLAILVGTWAICLWRGREAPPIVVRLLVIALFVRFAVPLAATASEAAFRLALLGDYEAAAAQVGSATSTLDGAANELQGESNSWWARITARVKSLKQATPEALAVMRQRAEMTTQHVVTLIALFVVQTVLLPLLFLWFLYRLLALLVRHPLVSSRNVPHDHGLSAT